MKAMKKLGGIVLSAALALALVVVLVPTSSAKADSTVRVWFDNSDNWDTVYVYDAEADWANANADWPGVEVTTSQDGWYYVDVSTDIRYIIFTDNSVQTCDIQIPEGTTEAWVDWATYDKELDDSAKDIVTTQPDGAPSIGGGDEDDGDGDEPTPDEPTPTADMLPVAGIVVALLGCGVIAFAVRKKRA